MWTNIIDNAIDAMPSGGMLTIRTTRGEPFITISIGDTGDGIPEEIKEQISDPFFTTKDVGKGKGRGLDSVNKIISNHKGAIDVESKPGFTIFDICIPAVDAN